MMETLQRKSAARAEAVAERWRRRVAARLAALLPGAAVRVEEDRVAASGRGLFARRDRDPALRWIGGDARWE